MKKIPQLKVENLTKSYNNRTVVNGLSFEVNEGEVVGLIGPNGAGKTTAFYMTIGLIKAEKGSVFFQNQDYALGFIVAGIDVDHLFHARIHILQPFFSLSHLLIELAFGFLQQGITTHLNKWDK